MIVEEFWCSGCGGFCECLAYGEALSYLTNLCVVYMSGLDNDRGSGVLIGHGSGLRWCEGGSECADIS